MDFSPLPTRIRRRPGLPPLPQNPQHDRAHRQAAKVPMAATTTCISPRRVSDPEPRSLDTPGSIKRFRTVFQHTPESLKRLEAGWRARRLIIDSADPPFEAEAKTTRLPLRPLKGMGRSMPPAGTVPPLQNDQQPSALAADTPASIRHPRRLTPPDLSVLSHRRMRPPAVMRQQRVHFSPGVCHGLISRDKDEPNEPSNGDRALSNTAVISISGLPTPPASPELDAAPTSATCFTEVRPGERKSLSTLLNKEKPVTTDSARGARSLGLSEAHGDAGREEDHTGRLATRQFSDAPKPMSRILASTEQRAPRTGIKAKLFLPLGRLVVDHAGPTFDHITLSFSITPLEPAQSSEIYQSQSRRVCKVRVRLTAGSGELRIDTSASCTACPSGEIDRVAPPLALRSRGKLRTKRILHLPLQSVDPASARTPQHDWSRRLKHLQSEAEECGTWLEEEREGLRRFLLLRDEWGRYMG